jgi:diphthamide synthase (EF-2-diphthine--ammonia ligase)
VSNSSLLAFLDAAAVEFLIVCIMGVPPQGSAVIMRHVMNYQIVSSISTSMQSSKPRIWTSLALLTLLELGTNRY